MRKHIHTALVIFALAFPCAGQWTEVWTNGDLYAVQDMASQCYSASVERCQAVGVTPDEPSWWDYIVGKNHAKLLSVKANIEACVLIFGRYVTNSYGFAFWSDSADFLTNCGLSTNALSETPFFSSQQTGVTGGWRDVYVMLTNMSISGDDTIPLIDPANVTSYEWHGAGESTNTFAEAESQAISDWSTNAGSTEAAWAWVDVYTASTFEVYLYRNMLVKSYPSAPFARNVKAWVYTEPYNFYDYEGHTDYTNSGWSLLYDFSGGVSEFDIVVGQTNPVFTLSGGDENQIGYWAHSWRVAYDWSTPSNGFKFK